MRRKQFAAALLLALPLADCGSGSPAGNPAGNTNTTLADQTGNNTSAAAGFSAQANGNLGANNVSKVNVHSLLYPGSTTKVLAHCWFGSGNPTTSTLDTAPLIRPRCIARLPT